MGVVLSSQVYSATFTASSRAALVDAISDAMVQGGWSRTGSSGDWNLSNGAHPRGFSVTIRVWDPGSGDYANISIVSPVDMQSTFPTALRAGLSGDWRIIVCPNQAVCFHTPTFDTDDGRKWIFSVPWSPEDFVTFGTTTTLIAVTTGDRCGFSNVSPAMRNFEGNAGLFLGGGQALFLPGWQRAWVNIAHVRVPFEVNSPVNSEWAKGVLHAEASRLALRDSTDTSRTVGYLWDAFTVVGSGVNIGTQWTYDGNNYMCVAYAGGDQARLFVRVS